MYRTFFPPDLHRSFYSVSEAEGSTALIITRRRIREILESSQAAAVAIRPCSGGVSTAFWPEAESAGLLVFDCRSPAEVWECLQK